jgi:hypothetical protein
MSGQLQPQLLPRYGSLIQERFWSDCDESVRETALHILDLTANNQTVTVIHLISPANKQTGPGRTSYFQWREELWNTGKNLVEIDLLRDGEPTILGTSAKLAKSCGWTYLMTVTRHFPSSQGGYGVPLNRPLPTIKVPLYGDDPEVSLDLQAAFNLCWDRGPYPALSRYDGPPPGRMTGDEIVWCEQRLRNAGLRDVTT